MSDINPEWEKLGPEANIQWPDLTPLNVGPSPKIENENHPNAVNASVHCPYCSKEVWTFRISENEERGSICSSCNRLFAVRWMHGQSFTAQIAWPMSELERHADIGMRWENDNSLEEWFPITAALMKTNEETIRSQQEKISELQQIISSLQSRSI